MSEYYVIQQYRSVTQSVRRYLHRNEVTCKHPSNEVSWQYDW